MPEQRGLYPRMRVAEQLSYFAQQHGMSGKARQRGGRAAGSSGWASPTARSPSSRSCRTATSSGSSSRRRSSTTRSCSSSTSRSRGLDPIGIATMTEVVRERAAAGVGVVFSQPPARPRRGRVRGRRDHRPRPDRRLGRHRRAEGARRAASTSRSRSPDRTATGSTAVPAAGRSSGPATGSSCWSTATSTSTACSPAPARPARSGRSPTSRRSCPSCSWKRSRPSRRSRPEVA